MSAQPPSGQPLLLVIDPVARAADGESVRVAKDVLCAGAPVKIVLPQSGESLDRLLAHRGKRRLVIVGDDRALHRMVQTLHHRGELSHSPVSYIPVGPASMISLAFGLGLPAHPAPAARTALRGTERSLDLLVDDGGCVVLGSVEISGSAFSRRVIHDRGGNSDGEDIAGGGSGAWWSSVGHGARTLVRGLRISLPRQLPRLRVEADGVVLADQDRPMRFVAVSNTGSRGTRAHADGAGDQEGGRPDDGLVEVEVQRRQQAQRRPVLVRARAVTVSGRDFSYMADAELVGPVRARTWTVRPAAWRLTVPSQPR